jgi:hypothetical protein
MKRQILNITTTALGAATVNGSAVLGKLFAIEYRPGTLDTDAILVITAESDTSKPLLSLDSVGTSALLYYPRDLVHAVANGAALTGAAGGDRALPVLNGTPRVVVTDGGDTGVGSVVIYYLE